MSNAQRTTSIAEVTTGWDVDPRDEHEVAAILPPLYLVEREHVVSDAAVLTASDDIARLAVAFPAEGIDAGCIPGPFEVSDQRGLSFHILSSTAERDAEIMARFAAHLLQLGQVERALSVAAAARLVDGTEPLPHFVIGCILAQSGEAHAAIVSFSEAVLLCPDWLDARANLAELYLLVGNLPAASCQLESILRADPAAHSVAAKRARCLAKQTLMELV